MNVIIPRQYSVRSHFLLAHREGCLVITWTILLAPLCSYLKIEGVRFHQISTIEGLIKVEKIRPFYSCLRSGWDFSKGL